MDFLELVTGARTCRRFPGSRGDARRNAGLAYCVCPRDALRWKRAGVAVCRCGIPGSLRRRFPGVEMAGMLTDWDGPEAGERPTGYVAILGEAGTRAKLNAIDAGIAAQTIQLAAYTRDLGCCIFLSFDPRKIREVLGIPENLEPLLVLALGFQKEVRRVETVGADGSVKYWRDAQGVHHVPKRPLEDLLIIKK